MNKLIEIFEETSLVIVITVCTVGVVSILIQILVKLLEI